MAIPFQSHSNIPIHPTSEVESWHAQGNVKLIDFGSAKDLANPQVKGAGIHNFKTVMQAECTMCSPCVHYIYIYIINDIYIYILIYIYTICEYIYIYNYINIYICPSSMWPGLKSKSRDVEELDTGRTRLALRISWLQRHVDLRL